PSPASITPAFRSSSLYFPISVSSFWLGMPPASDCLVAFTITRNRIVSPPYFQPAELSDLRGACQQRADAAVAQPESGPENRGEVDRSEYVRKKRISDPHMCGDRPAQVARPQNRADQCGSRNQVE